MQSKRENILLTSRNEDLKNSFRAANQTKIHHNVYIRVAAKGTSIFGTRRSNFSLHVTKSKHKTFA